jgi:VWFA-related protein
MRIPTIWTVLLAFIIPFSCIGEVSGQATDPPGQVPKFREDINVVNVLFTARDRHGALVSNLNKDEFQVLEDGKLQTIKDLEAQTSLPLALGLLLDSSRGMGRTLEITKVVAVDFLRQVITDKDLAFVISFDVSVDLLQDLTPDVRLLGAGIQRAKINVGGGGGGIPGLRRGATPTLDPKGALLYDGVYLASAEILTKQVGRKTMVITTGGKDGGSRLKLRDAIKAAQEADAICYLLLLHDPQDPASAGEIGQLTEATGGRVIEVNNPNKIGDAFAEVSSELRSQYRLGYTPENSKRDGTFRRIEIRSKNGYKVQTRKGYYAPSN